MKVLQINAVYKISSTGRNVFELHEFLLENNMDSYVACADDKKNGGVYIIGTWSERKIHALMSRLSGLQGYFSVRGTKNLIKYMKQIKPDIVHLGNLHANYIHLPMLLSYLADNDIRTVITLHDCWFFTGKCTHYTIRNCYKWKDGCGHCPQLGVDNKSWFFDQTHKMWNDKRRLFEAIPRLAVIGVSDWITSEANKSLLGKARIIKRIYNWEDLKTFKYVDSANISQKLGLEDKFVILGVASKWDNRKGLDTFIKLANELDENERLILVGDIPKCSLPDKVIYIPATNNIQELVSYYSLADVFMQLSIEESFGKVVSEALACGTPIITINSTANRELVSDKCGIVLESLEMSRILEAIHEIERYGKEYYRSACREFAEDNFGLYDRVMDYIKVYQQLMEMSELEPIG